MYNTADYIDLDCYNARPILGSRPILPKKKEKEVHKLLGILYFVLDENGNEWYFNPKKDPKSNNWYIKKPQNGFKLYEWRWLYCNECDFEIAYNTNPFPTNKINVDLQFNLIFD